MVSKKKIKNAKVHCELKLKNYLKSLTSIDNFSILGNDMNNYHLSLKESFLIFKLKPSLNVARVNSIIFV